MFISVAFHNLIFAVSASVNQKYYSIINCVTSPESFALRSNTSQCRCWKTSMCPFYNTKCENVLCQKRSVSCLAVYYILSNFIQVFYILFGNFKFQDEQICCFPFVYLLFFIILLFILYFLPKLVVFCFLKQIAV